MTRLIDADEIRWADHYDADGNLSKYKVAYSDELPPTIDAVPVIRCKDCKYNDAQQWVACTLIPQMFGKNADNNFCSYAEPKDTTEEVRKQLKDMEQRREMDRKK